MTITGATMGSEGPDRSFDTRRSIRRLIATGLLVSALLVGGLGGWAAETRLSGAVIAPGRLIVDSSVKKVQPPNGGVVGQLLVREGQAVRVGDVLLRLDPTEAQANLDIINQSLDELAARRARNEAEIEGVASISFPAEFATRAAKDRILRLESEETALFVRRQASRDGQKEQLREQVEQFEEESRGLTSEIAAKQAEVALNDEELKGIQDLWAQHLVSLTRLTALRRDAVRLGGEKAHMVSLLAEMRAKRAETRLKIIQIDADLRSEDAKEIGEIRARTSELQQRKVSAEDQLRRIDIKAPIGGLVHALAIHTVGAVVTSGETVMLIVPENETLTVEARLQPTDIDQIHLAQHVVVRFSGLGARTTPDLNGTVSLVSPDLDQDDKTGASFYAIRVALSPREIARLGGDLKLVAGMPVESFVETKPRTVISYLIQPMRDQIERAFRER